jgi:AraC-like DNA-binding protein
LIGVVLSGVKEVWRGEVSERLAAGALFVLPAEIDLDIVNEPDDRTGFYQSLILEIKSDSIPELGLVDVQLSTAPESCAIPLTSALADAVTHAAHAIADGPAAAAVRNARRCELLALLHGVPEAQPLFNMSASERVARLVRAGIDQDWTVARMARRLAMSESTLRRRLADGGQSFSSILRRERMDLARRLIAQGMGSGAAALAVGYASRAHFARAYRAAFGDNPATRAA